MSWGPLHIPDVPVVGPDGRRRNVTEIYHSLAGVIPRGRLLAMEVAHDHGCPCEGDPRRPLGACTCTTVDVTLRLVEPLQS